MNRPGQLAVISIALALSLFAGGGCSTPGPKPLGHLAGQVTIGPLVPVLREGQAEPTPSPEMYAMREVVVFDASGKREVARASIRPDGSYEIALPEGDYRVDINHQGIDMAAGLPASVHIEGGQTYRLDIDIDTGIR